MLACVFVKVPSFTDIAGHPLQNDILWLASVGVTNGCQASPAMFCPDAGITRGQMAAFLVRAFELPAASADYFDDDNGTLFEANINSLAEAGITRGCGARLFCASDAVSRGQMAAFLVRAFGLPSSTTDYFTDDAGNQFEANINALAASGITRGCGPSTFCPTAVVTRAQMAAFLHRAFTN